MALRRTKLYCSISCRNKSHNHGKGKCSDCGFPCGKRSKRCSSCSKIHLSDLKIKSGHSWKKFATTESEARRKSGISGRVMVKESAARFSAVHHCAKECLLRDPRGVVHYCRNIMRFVWQNTELFNEDDVRRKQGSLSKSYYCRAVNGLYAVHSGTVGTWKGWTLVSDVEIKEGGWDLLRRKQKGGASNDTAPTRVNHSRAHA